MLTLVKIVFHSVHSNTISNRSNDNTISNDRISKSGWQSDSGFVERHSAIVDKVSKNP